MRNELITQPKSLRRYFLSFFIRIAITFSLVISLLAAWRDYKSTIRSRIDSQSAVFESFVNSVKQPLIQGSYIEAKVRAAEVAKSDHVSCVEIKYGVENLTDCRPPKGEVGQNRMARALYFHENHGEQFAALAITFDNSDLTDAALRNFSQSMLGFMILSIALFASLSIGFSRINLELNRVLLTSSKGGKRSSAVFQIIEFDELEKKLLLQIEISKMEAAANGIIDLATQVAHDLRSPIMALKNATQGADGLSNDRKELISKVTERITGIAEDLLTKRRLKTLEKDSEISHSKTLPLTERFELVAAIKMAVIEKNLLLDHWRIEADLPFDQVFVNGQREIFARILSNLFQNALEACSGTLEPSISVALRIYKSSIQVSVVDNGKGIPASKLSQLGYQVISFGKENGNGLGIYGAKKEMVNWNGKLTIESKESVGTIVTLSFPIITERAHL